MTTTTTSPPSPCPAHPHVPPPYTKTIWVVCRTGRKHLIITRRAVVVVLTVILIVIAMSLAMLKVRLLGLEYGLRRVHEASALIRIGLVLELVARGRGVWLCISFFSSGKYISSLLIGRYSYGKSILFIAFYGL